MASDNHKYTDNERKTFNEHPECSPQDITQQQRDAAQERLSDLIDDTHQKIKNPRYYGE